MDAIERFYDRAIGSACRLETRGRVMERERVISITLTESEWQAFVARQPRPVDWLRARICDELQRPAHEGQSDGLLTPARKHDVESGRPRTTLN